MAKSRSVVVVGEIVKDEHGEVAATRGFYIDITAALHDDIQRAIPRNYEEIVTHRAPIEQAKGMLMAVYDLAPDIAFDILRWRSQELNIKLHDVAGELVTHLPSLLNVPGQARGAVDHFLMTLDKPE